MTLSSNVKNKNNDSGPSQHEQYPQADLHQASLNLENQAVSANESLQLYHQDIDQSIICNVENEGLIY
jgi:hypothetical protein